MQVCLSRLLSWSTHRKLGTDRPPARIIPFLQQKMLIFRLLKPKKKFWSVKLDSWLWVLGLHGCLTPVTWNALVLHLLVVGVGTAAASPLHQVVRTHPVAGAVAVNQAASGNKKQCRETVGATSHPDQSLENGEHYPPVENGDVDPPCSAYADQPAVSNH